jgi:hypothetical protein
MDYRSTHGFIYLILMEEMCQYCLIAFYHNQFLLQNTNILWWGNSPENDPLGAKLAEEMYCVLVVLVLSS